MTFKYVELFAGIGGFRQALDRAGGRCVFASEIDKFAVQAYEALCGVAVGEYPRYRIRKLTPLECWRWQGFSDEAHEAVKDAGISDSQRYKQAGNAVTVNVIEALSERLLPLLNENKAEVAG